MEPRIHFLTFATADLDAEKFTEDLMGQTTTSAVSGVTLSHNPGWRIDDDGAVSFS